MKICQSKSISKIKKLYIIILCNHSKNIFEDIKSNWKSLNTCSNGKAAAVIKANAYGMGMLKVAGALLEAGCNYFYVANINEV